MSLKDAVSNSLLMFVAATCVVLVIRALPPAQPSAQVAAGGGGTNAPAAQVADIRASAPAMQDGYRVYYLHGNTRCPTCRSIEAFAKEAVETGFVDKLKSRQIEWQVINYESPGNEHYATDYEVVAPNVVLVKFKDGKQVAWKGLPEVWEHVGDKAAFTRFIQNSLREFMGEPQAVSSEKPNASRPSDVLPVPTPSSNPMRPSGVDPVPSLPTNASRPSDGPSLPSLPIPGK
jgi:hypothetical protein